jgi:hypothetical protein
MLNLLTGFFASDRVGIAHLLRILYRSPSEGMVGGDRPTFLLDECVPRPVKLGLIDGDIRTVVETSSEAL